VRAIRSLSPYSFHCLTNRVASVPGKNA
jgi:hypothetical protein